MLWGVNHGGVSCYSTKGGPGKALKRGAKGVSARSKTTFKKKPSEQKPRSKTSVLSKNVKREEDGVELKKTHSRAQGGTKKRKVCVCVW